MLDLYSLGVSHSGWLKIFKCPLHFLISSPNETNYNQTKWSLHIIITIIWSGKVDFDVEQSPFSTHPYLGLWWLKFFKTFFQHSRINIWPQERHFTKWCTKSCAKCSETWKFQFWAYSHKCKAVGWWNVFLGVKYWP